MEESVDHTCCNLDELDRLRQENARLRSTLSTVLPDGNHPFLCGKGGESDANHMPEYFYICPAFGSDLTYIYKRFKS